MLKNYAIDGAILLPGRGPWGAAKQHNLHLRGEEFIGFVLDER